MKKRKISPGFETAWKKDGFFCSLGSCHRMPLAVLLHTRRDGM
jgi:hypothetical protein